MPSQPCLFDCQALTGEAEARAALRPAMLQEWSGALLADDDYWDQNAFNDLMIRGAVVSERRPDRLVWCAPLPFDLVYPGSLYRFPFPLCSPLPVILPHPIPCHSVSVRTFSRLCWHTLPVIFQHAIHGYSIMVPVLACPACDPTTSHALL